MTTKLYALVNRLCGHAVSVANNPDMVHAVRNQLALLGRFTWVVRQATDADLECVVAGTRCGSCDLAPWVVL